MCSFGALVRVGVDYRGTYGAGPPRCLQQAGITVLEYTVEDRSIDADEATTARSMLRTPPMPPLGVFIPLRPRLTTA